MDFSLRLLTDADVDALQDVYDACPTAFTTLLGAPARPEQAARDFVQAIATPGRYQFGILVGQTLTGVIDCKLDDGTPGRSDIGMLLLAPPYDDPDIRGLALRILERWLAQAYGVTRLQTSVPAHVPAELAWWQAQGFAFTGEQYRRDLPGYSPRLLVMRKDLARNVPDTFDVPGT
jgi:hypothetical protein